MVSTQDSFALVSATDRANISKKTIRDGGLFLIDLKSDDYTLIPLTSNLDFAIEPHGISYIKKDSTYHLAVINHAYKKHSIELFELNERTLLHKKTLTDKSMIQPNDLVMIDENRFYFTNDHGYTEGIGKIMEEYLGVAASNVVYYDGKKFKEVAKDIAYANGIIFDKNRDLIFVSEMRGFSVNVYHRLEDGLLSLVEDIPCGTGVDNIEFDEDNNLWIGCHPNLLEVSAYRGGKKEIAPSEIIKINYKNKGDYTIEKIYVEEGHEMSASSVAAVYNDFIFLGNVKDDKILVLKMN